jgi:para-nitrobenzyl esterase
VGRRMQRAWLDFVTAQPSPDWPSYKVPHRATRVIKSTRDIVVDDPDRARREAWSGIH